MKLKKILVIALLIAISLTNIISVEAKTKKKSHPPIFHTFDKEQFARGTGKYSKVRAILQEVDYSSQFPFTALNCADGDETTKYYARKDTVKVTTSKPDKYGYMNTTFIVKIGKRVFNEYNETVSRSVEDIYNAESRDNFGYADIIVFH